MSDSAMDRLKVLPQYLVPHHLLSRFMGLLAESRWPLIRDNLVDFFINRYNIDMSIAAPSPLPVTSPTTSATRPSSSMR